jgi:hypothetical protein
MDRTAAASIGELRSALFGESRREWSDPFE